MNDEADRFSRKLFWILVVSTAVFAGAAWFFVIR